MSEELKNITGSVMDKIHHDKIQMRPRVYFIIGTTLTFIGLVASVFTSIFLLSLLRFSLRSHGPMGEYRWEQLVSSFPLWALLIAILGLVIGIGLLRRYDFSYKTNFMVVIIGFIFSVIISGWMLDMTGLNDVLYRHGPMKGMMRQYLQENDLQPGSGLGVWRNNR